MGGIHLLEKERPTPASVAVTLEIPGPDKTPPPPTAPVGSPVPPAVPSAVSPSDARPGPRRNRLVFPALLLALLLAALGQTIVATALPKAAGELHGLDGMSWALISYLLAATIVLPVHGKLGDLFGRKGPFLFALAVFVIGSALAGWSRSTEELTVYRALQGIGAGGLVVGAQAITADLVPPRARGRHMGLIGATLGLAVLAGPALGGFVTDHVSWRWCFYANVPLGALTFLVLALALKLPRPARRHKLDVPGALLLAAATSCLILLAHWAVTEYGWQSRAVLGLAAGAVVTALLFLVIEHTADEPILPPRLFRDSVFTVTSVLSALVGAALFGVASHLPAYLQLTEGASATESGLLILPMAGGVMLASITCGQLIARTGRYKLYLLPGCGTVAVGMWLLSRLEPGTPRVGYGAWLAIVGIGIGLVLPVLILAMQNSVRPADLGAATGAHNYARQLGGSAGVVGVTAFGALPQIFLYFVPVLVLGLVLSFLLKEKPLVVTHTHIPEARSPQPRTGGVPLPSGGVPVCGAVQHHDGSSVPRAALTLIDSGGGQIGRSATGEDGRYALTVPGAGSYVLIAAAAGHQPQAVSVTVGERPVDLDVVLGGAGQLGGSVLTPEGNPVRDAAVTLTDVRGEVVATARSGCDGGYVMADLVAGEYTLAASAPVYRPAALPVTVQAARETQQDIELAGGAVLRGTVRTKDAGRPIEDARVTLMDAAGNVVDTALTGADGTFRFADLASGEYTVIAAGYPPVATVLQIAGGGRTEHDLQLAHDA
ncbi:MFS transporter [Streptomyces gobiensis]|uniref:MFS transporter n=1 Tax=Streptomyces gobiensis TaxID=2875706 RepID=UPI001E31DA1A|nr:MDR family MFS transporter [Streptomyces gobiensis]UGY94374.1 DHA2 family efflux MFS transporter permease subunit [Streptomyces gobiensis]